MGLYLNRDKNGDYRRAWYCKMTEGGRVTGRRLKTPLRGKIPLDASGSFSLDLTGDDRFEKSKAEAKAELAAILDRARAMAQEERNAPGYIEREVYRKTTGRAFKVVEIAAFADRNAERPRYAHTDKGNGAKVYNILSQFSAWCAKTYNADRPKKEQVKTIADITPEVAAAYYASIVKTCSWATFRASVFTLGNAFRYFMPNVVENPFAKAYEDNYRGRNVKLDGGEILDKGSIRHEAPTPEQVRRIWDCAAHMTQYPYLRRLAVLAACSGLRIGDCCNLTWDKVDLLNRLIDTAKTAKTGAEVTIPIFDHDPKAWDFNPIFGELRRELEAALAEREDGAKYVIPQAAAQYAKDPDLITKIGKRLFARALFADAEPEDAQLVEEAKPPMRPVDVLRLIENSVTTSERRDRLLRTYELRMRGKTYSQIARAIGGRKSVVSQDLASIEELTGERIRPGAHTGTTLREALRRTRQVRTHGTKAGCRFGWHSLRVFFVVTAIQAGIKVNDLKRVTGHSTVNMVLHYYNPEDRQAAEKMRQSMSCGCAETVTGTQGAEAATDGAAILANAIQAVLAAPALTPEAKNAAVAAIVAANTPKNAITQ